jgi:hypothetical protein
MPRRARSDAPYLSCVWRGSRFETSALISVHQRLESFPLLPSIEPQARHYNASGSPGASPHHIALLLKKLAVFRVGRYKTRRAHGQTDFMISWQGKAVSVRARYVPRFVWTTASIDVYLDDRCVLRTGGQFKLTGSHSATFTDGSTEHRMELTWGGSGGFRFP